MIEEIFSQPFFTALSMTLLHFLWQGILIAAVLKCLLIITSQTRSLVRYSISIAAMAANLVVPLLTFALLYQQNQTQESLITTNSLMHDLPLTLNIPMSQWYDDYAEVLPWLSLLWLVGVCYLTCRLILDFLNIQKLPKQDVIAPEDDINFRFKQLVAQLDIRSNPRLLISLKATVPMALGWLKPVVLLPANMLTGLTNDQLEMLMLHELAHIRRNDYLVNLIQTFIEILLFFHPAVKWVSKQVRSEREFCSDDIAVQHCGNPIAYAHTLTDTATLCRNHIPQMAVAASGGDLKQRVIRIVNHHCSSVNNPGKFYAAILILLLLTLTAIQQLLTVSVLDVTKVSIQLYNQPFKVEHLTTYPNNETHQDQLDAANLLLNNSYQPILRSALPTFDIEAFSSVADTIVSKSENIPSEKTDVMTKATTKQRKTIEQSDKNTNVLASTKPTEQPVIAPHTDDVVSKSAELKLTQKSEPILNTTNSNRSVVADNTLIEREVSPIAQETDQVASVSLNTFKGRMTKDVNSTEQVVENAVNFEANALQLSKSNAIADSFVAQYQETKNSVQSSKTDENINTKNKHRSAQVIESYNPKYPALAKRRGVESEIEVSFIVDVNGKVTNLQFSDENGVNYFKRAIQTAVKKWRFKPALQNGKPIESTITKIFSFSLVS